MPPTLTLPGRLHRGGPERRPARSPASRRRSPRSSAARSAARSTRRSRSRRTATSSGSSAASWLESNLGYAVQDFYRNGGSTAIIVRVHKTKANDTASMTLGSGTRAGRARGRRRRARGARSSPATIDDDVADPTDTTLVQPHRHRHRHREDRGRSATSRSRPAARGASTSCSTNAVDARASRPGSLPTHAAVVVPGDRDRDERQRRRPDRRDALHDRHEPPRRTRRACTRSRTPTSSTCIVIPPYTSTRRDRLVRCSTDTISYAEERRAVMIIDPPAAWSSARQRRHRRVGGVVHERARTRRSTSRSIHEPDPLRDGQIVPFAPCGAIAGVMRAHRRDARRVEGAGRARRDASAASSALSDPAHRPRDRPAQPARRQLPAQPRPAPGITVWGARTRDGDDRLASSGSTSRCGARRSSSRSRSTAARSGSCSSRTTSRCGRRSGSTSARS